MSRVRDLLWLRLPYHAETEHSSQSMHYQFCRAGSPPVVRTPKVVSASDPEINGPGFSGAINFDFSLKSRSEFSQSRNFPSFNDADFALCKACFVRRLNLPCNTRISLLCGALNPFAVEHKLIPINFAALIGRAYRSTSSPSLFSLL